MTIKELKTIIAQLPDGMEIIIPATDSDDNRSYAPLKSCQTDCVYDKEENMVYYDIEEDEYDEEEWKLIQSLPRCLVLFVEF